MKKATIYITLAEAMIIILAALIITYQPQQDITGFAVSLPDDCGDDAIKTVWSYVFKQNSEGLTIKKQGTTNCSFFAYKNISKETYILLGTNEYLQGVYGNFSNEFIRSLVEPTNAQEGNELLQTIQTGDILDRSSSVGSTLEANTIATSLFQYNPISWTESGNKYLHQSSEIEIEIYKSLTRSTLTYEPLSEDQPSTNCTESWTYTNWGTCKANETQTRKCTDSNTCGTTKDKKETTRGCDYDKNGIIGGKTDISTTRVNLQLKIANETLNISKNYTGTKKIELKDGSKNLLEFNWNFGNALDLTNLEITKQTNSSKVGYTIINGLDTTKTVYIEKKKSTSNSVCIIDDEIDNINNMTADCNASNEILLNCPGTHQATGIKCNITNNMFEVKGIAHSAIKEVTDETATPACTPLTCEVMGFECGVHVDTNCSTQVPCGNCATGLVCTNGKCITPPCEPDWECPDFSEKCPKNETLHRKCVDQNNCGKTQGKPPETKSCEYKSKLPIIIIISSIILILVGGAIGLLYFLKKRKTPTSGTSASTPMTPSSPKPTTPAPPKVITPGQRKMPPAKPMPRGPAPTPIPMPTPTPTPLNNNQPTQ